MSFVPCLTFVRKGVARAQPEKAEVTEDDLQRIIQETRENMGKMSVGDVDDLSETEEGTAAAAKSDGKRKKRSAATAELDEKEDLKGLEEYGLENYDDEDVDDGDGWGGVPGVSYFASNDDDPYITMKNEADDSDSEDNAIKDSDNLLVVGKADQEHSIIEIHIYNEQEGSLFVHHDFVLPSFPLAVEWLDFTCGPGKSGNCVAIGTMESTIDIWNLDVLHSLEPVARLGNKPRKSKSKKRSAGTGGHSDAVLDLSWNSLSRTELASGSADFTIGLWDLAQCTLKTSIRHHQEKVQALQWHPFEEQSLLSGSFDNTARLFDCRNPDTAHKVWKVNGEVERVMWNHFSPFYFLTSTDQGMVYYYDARVDDKPVFTLQAHTAAVTGLAFSSQMPGLLLTTSADKTAKVWDIIEEKPEMVLDKSFAHMGDLMCCACCPDSPFTFAIGGEKEMKVWTLNNNASVKSHFSGRSPVSTSQSAGPVSTEQDKEEVLKSGEVKTSSAVTGTSESKSTPVGNNAQTKSQKKKRKKKGGKR